MNLPFSLDELKRHCRVDADFTDDDALLIAYGKAAILDGENRTNRSWSEWDEGSFPESLKIWCFLRVASLYEHRTDLAVTRGGRVASMPRDFAPALLDRFWLPHENETTAG